MTNSRFAIILGLLVAWTPLGQAKQTHSAAADSVTRLADAFVAEYGRRFPFTVIYTGLPLEVQSGIDINTPRELTHWRRFVRSIQDQLDHVPESDLTGRSEWITRAYLEQGIAQVRADEICRSELWNISPYGWVFQLPPIAEAQPVATLKERREALERWSGLAAWIDQMPRIWRKGCAKVTAVIAAPSKRRSSRLTR